ncbi:MAG: hypothetical protein CMA61_02875 [Euryarchaeota archaeon]|jgi:hypothetical protein|nr:hypothetical protein [Euryarchaeota archaeon]
MGMDNKVMMNEMGGAFMVAWLAGGMGTLEGALILAAAWMAIGGAHILPVITWGHIMTGDLGDSDAWMGNASRLIAQILGAALALLVMTEGGDLGPAYVAEEMWAFDMWTVVGSLAGGALLWTVYDRCDAWVAAIGVMALSGALALGGASDMGAMLLNMGDADLVASLANWVLNGAFAGVGALASVKLAEAI